MKFVLEATAHEFDLAAEQEILLRYVADRKLKWRNVALVAFALVALSITMASTGAADPMKLAMLSGGLCVILVLQQLKLDRTGGNPYPSLKQLYRGRMVQTAEQMNAPLRLVIDENGYGIEIYNAFGKAGDWSFQHLCRVIESDEVFELVCKGLPKQYLALPKSALREGTVDELRELFNDLLDDKHPVVHYDIPESYRQSLANAKKKLFG